jgi:hypothetical protein
MQEILEMYHFSGSLRVGGGFWGIMNRTLMGWMEANGGAISAISMHVMAKLHTSACRAR